MQSIAARDREASVGGLTLPDLPYPHAAEKDVIVRVHAAGFTPGELEWPGTWTARAGRDRTPSVPGHELSGRLSSWATAALPISGLTASQGLFVHAGLTTGQTVVIHGAAGGVGSIALPLALEVGARVIGTGRTGDRDVVLGLGAQAFLDLDADPLEDIGEVDVVFDVIGGDVLERSTALVARGHPCDHRHAT